MPDPDSIATTTPHERRSARLRAGLRAAELALALAGSACLLAWGASCARTSHVQATQSVGFDEALRERVHAQLVREAPNPGEWAADRVAKYEASLAAPVEALGRLEIPTAGVSVMVLEGDDDGTLDRAVGRIPGTARLGERGNVGIAGHRDGWFRGLRHLERGDALTLTTLEGTATYEVASIEIVAPSRVDVLAPTDEPTLTLVTCYPFYYVGDAPKRYIVTARQVRYEPWLAAAAEVGPADHARR